MLDATPAFAAVVHSANLALMLMREIKTARPSQNPRACSEYNDENIRTLRVQSISDHGLSGETIQFFGGVDQLRNAFNQPQSLLYAV